MKEELKGKSFIYKSKYGGIAEGIIEEVIKTTAIEGIGDYKLIETNKGSLPLYENYIPNKEDCIRSTNGVIYNLKDIEIL